MHEIVQPTHQLHYRFIKQAGYSLKKAPLNDGAQNCRHTQGQKGAYTYQVCFNDYFIFNLANSKFLPRLVPLQEHVSKLIVKTTIMVNGIRLVLKNLKVFSPNDLIKK